jgi:hypothetical protein
VGRRGRLEASTISCLRRSNKEKNSACALTLIHAQRFPDADVARARAAEAAVDPQLLDGMTTGQLWEARLSKNFQQVGRSLLSIPHRSVGFRISRPDVTASCQARDRDWLAFPKIGIDSYFRNTSSSSLLGTLVRSRNGR